jgi:hypothetical protein
MHTTANTKHAKYAVHTKASNRHHIYEVSYVTHKMNMCPALVIRIQTKFEVTWFFWFINYRNKA